jgi:cellulose biosynthesis protein BcsQ
MNALIAPHAVLAPTQLDYLSVAGLALLMETVEEVRDYDNPNPSYGPETWQRLQAVRAAWDPENVFAAGHAISLPARERPAG